MTLREPQWQTLKYMYLSGCKDIAGHKLLWIFFCCRIKSRWFCIQFEELCPKLTGADRYKKEADLKSVMKKSSKSVAAVTSVMSIEGITADKLYESMDDIIEEACFSDLNLKDIDRCAKKDCINAVLLQQGINSTSSEWPELLCMCELRFCRMYRNTSGFLEKALNTTLKLHHAVLNVQVVGFHQRSIKLRKTILQIRSRDSINHLLFIDLDSCWTWGKIWWGCGEDEESHPSQLCPDNPLKIETATFSWKRPASHWTPSERCKAKNALKWE